MSARTIELDELQGKLADMKEQLRKMDYQTPQWLKAILPAMMDAIFILYKLSRYEAEDTDDV